MFVSSPDITLCGWLGSKHRLTIVYSSLYSMQPPLYYTWRSSLQYSVTSVTYSRLRNQPVQYAAASTIDRSTFLAFGLRICPFPDLRHISLAAYCYNMRQLPQQTDPLSWLLASGSAPFLTSGTFHLRHAFQHCCRVLVECSSQSEFDLFGWKCNSRIVEKLQILRMRLFSQHYF